MTLGLRRNIRVIHDPRLLAREVRRRGRNLARRRSCRLLSYTTVVRLLNVYLDTPVGRRRARSRANPLLRFLVDRGIPHDPCTTARRAFLHRTLFPWAYCRFVCCPADELWHWVTIRGLEHLDAARSAGRGVLLAGSHYGPGHMIDYALGGLGYEVTAVRARDSFVRKYGLSPSEPRLGTEVYIRDDSSGGLMATTIRARRLLRGGGIVKAALDGRTGGRGMWLELLGYRHLFHTALPLLADMENAAVIPAFVSVGPDGRIVVELGAPFPERDGVPPLDYAEDIVRQYVAALEAFCEREPASIDMARLQFSYDGPAHRKRPVPHITE